MAVSELLVVMLCVTTCHAAVLTVSDPSLGIKPALNASSQGDTVRVLAGLYTGPQNCDLVMDKPDVTLVAPDGPEKTIVDCGSSRSRCLSIFGVGAKVSGLSFVNGEAPGTAARLRGQQHDADDAGQGRGSGEVRRTFFRVYL